MCRKSDIFHGPTDILASKLINTIRASKEKPLMAILRYKKDFFKKIISQTCAARMLSFPLQVVPIGWTLMQLRIFLRPKTNVTQKVFLCYNNVHPMGTTSAENKSFLTAQV